MDEVFCTIVSRLRAFQAIALFMSLKNVSPKYQIYVLCVDSSTYNLFSKMKFSNVRLVRAHELSDKKLEEVKKQRKLNEYCWTLKPVFIERLFLENPSITRVTYIDADLFFWNNPSIIFINQPDSSVLLSRGDIIIPMLPLPLIKLLQDLMGLYNSGFISFRRHKDAQECLSWWKNRCLDSCISTPESGKFGDQKYLDEMPKLFPGVDEITTPGVNIGHWNNANHQFDFFDGVLCADNKKLICYHFSGYRFLRNGDILKIHENDRVYIPFFYSIYNEILVGIIQSIGAVDPTFDGFSTDEDVMTK